MWDALKEASEQPGVAVCVYVDANKGDPAGVKARLPAPRSPLREPKHAVPQHRIPYTHYPTAATANAKSRNLAWIPSA
jgi:hypothetical protein